MVRHLAAMLAVGLIVGLLDPAAAASFDCRRASNAHERHICSTPALDDADTRLGQAFRAASAAVPIRGFVLAVQRRFLASFPSCEREGDAACLAQLAEQTDKLLSLRGAAIYYGARPDQPYDPETMLWWLARQPDGTATVHMFGGFMPDMNRPEPFPAGWVCDERFDVHASGSGYVTNDPSIEVTVRPDRLSSNYSCSARNGAYGDYPRLR